MEHGNENFDDAGIPKPEIVTPKSVMDLERSWQKKFTDKNRELVEVFSLNGSQYLIYPFWKAPLNMVYYPRTKLSRLLRNTHPGGVKQDLTPRSIYLYWEAYLHQNEKIAKMFTEANWYQQTFSSMVYFRDENMPFVPHITADTYTRDVLTAICSLHMTQAKRLNRPEVYKSSDPDQYLKHYRLSHMSEYIGFTRTLACGFIYSFARSYGPIAEETFIEQFVNSCKRHRPNEKSPAREDYFTIGVAQWGKYFRQLILWSFDHQPEAKTAAVGLVARCITLIYAARNPGVFDDARLFLVLQIYLEYLGVWGFDDSKNGYYNACMAQFFPNEDFFTRIDADREVLTYDEIQPPRPGQKMAAGRTGRWTSKYIYHSEHYHQEDLPNITDTYELSFCLFSQLGIYSATEKKFFANGARYACAYLHGRPVTSIADTVDIPSFRVAWNVARFEGISGFPHPFKAQIATRIIGVPKLVRAERDDESVQTDVTLAQRERVDYEPAIRNDQIVEAPQVQEMVERIVAVPAPPQPAVIQREEMAERVPPAPPAEQRVYNPFDEDEMNYDVNAHRVEVATAVEGLNDQRNLYLENIRRDERAVIIQRLRAMNRDANPAEVEAFLFRERNQISEADYNDLMQFIDGIGDLEDRYPAMAPAIQQETMATFQLINETYPGLNAVRNRPNRLHIDPTMLRANRAEILQRMEDMRAAANVQRLFDRANAQRERQQAEVDNLPEPHALILADQGQQLMAVRPPEVPVADVAHIRYRDGDGDMIVPHELEQDEIRAMVNPFADLPGEINLDEVDPRALAQEMILRDVEDENNAVEGRMEANFADARERVQLRENQELRLHRDMEALARQRVADANEELERLRRRALDQYNRDMARDALRVAPLQVLFYNIEYAKRNTCSGKSCWKCWRSGKCCWWSGKSCRKRGRRWKCGWCWKCGR